MVSNWSRQTWDSATAECPQVTLLFSLANNPPAPWWKPWSLVSSSRVLSASVLGESPGQSPLLPQHYWPSLWVYPARSKAQEKPLCSTSLEPSPTCTQTQPLDSPPSWPTGSPLRSHVKLSTDSSSISAMQLGLQFPTQYFWLCIAHRSGLTEPSSMQFCIWTFLSWPAHHHWTSHVGRMSFRAGSRAASEWQRSVTEWWRAKAEKEHLNSKQQESPSKQKTPNSLLTIWESNHTGCELLCWGWDSHCVFVSTLLQASHDWHTSRAEGQSLMKLPFAKVIHHNTHKGKFYVTVLGQSMTNTERLRCKRCPFAYSQHKLIRCREWC